VTITTRAGEEFSAKAAVLAVPFNVWNDIAFDPPLSTPKREASSVPHPGACVKVWAVIENMPEEGLVGFTSDGEGCNWLVRFGTAEGGDLYMSFSGGYDLDVSTKDAFERACRRYIPEATVGKWDVHDWRANDRQGRAAPAAAVLDGPRAGRVSGGRPPHDRRLDLAGTTARA
jgi:hypothetical protein